MLISLVIAAQILTTSSLANASIQEKPLSKIAFASCLNQSRPQPLWDSVNKFAPNAFVFLGDNMYLDQNGSSNDFATEYAKLAGQPGYQTLKKTAKIFGTWDDHDFGLNDAGVEFPRKEEAQKAFCDFFGEPKDSPRRTRKGIYDSTIVGPVGQRIQFIMLDTRFNRTALTRSTEGRGYVPNTNPEATMLGAEQWAWFAEVLKQPAEIRIISSSIQVISEEHIFEGWKTMPLEKSKFFETIKTSGAAGCIVISGDRHLGEISLVDAGIGYPLYDVTASAFNRSSTNFRMPEANRFRVAGMSFGDNFGTLDVNWSQEDPTINIGLWDQEGSVVQQKLKLSWLQPGKLKAK